VLAGSVRSSIQAFESPTPTRCALVRGLACFVQPAIINLLRARSLDGSDLSWVDTALRPFLSERRLVPEPAITELIGF
jgi:hypothetical protein